MKSIRSIFVGQHKAYGQLAPKLRDEDGEELLPQKQSMRAGYRRSYSPQSWFNPSALKRMLASAVGRNWDAYRSELLVKLGRDELGRQALDWLEHRIARRTFMRDGEVMVNDDMFGTVPVSEAWDGYFVHPESRVICRRPASPRRVAARASNQDARMVLNDGVQLHRVGGVWYEVTLAPVSSLPRDEYGVAYAYDAVLMTTMNIGWHRNTLRETYGAADVYGKAKRQLNHRELVRYGLLLPKEQQAA